MARENQQTETQDIYMTTDRCRTCLAERGACFRRRSRTASTLVASSFFCWSDVDLLPISSQHTDTNDWLSTAHFQRSFGRWWGCVFFCLSSQKTSASRNHILWGRRETVAVESWNKLDRERESTALNIRSEGQRGGRMAIFIAEDGIVKPFCSRQGHLISKWSPQLKYEQCPESMVNICHFKKIWKFCYKVSYMGGNSFIIIIYLFSFPLNIIPKIPDWARLAHANMTIDGN